MRALFFLLLFAFSFLQADMLDDFINQEVSREIAFNKMENNTTAIATAIDKEKNLFIPFFLEFTTLVQNKEIRAYTPYRSQIFKLKRRIDTNAQRGNNYAVKRDELKLASFLLKVNIRHTLFKVLEIKFEDYSDFETKLEKIVIERHKKDAPLDLRKYNFVRNIEKPDPLTQSILDNLREYIALQDIHNNLSVVLMDDSQFIYKTVVLSSSGLLSFALYIENSNMAKQLSPLLNNFGLSTSKVIYILTILLMGLIFYFLVKIIFRHLFTWLGKSEDNTQYLLSQTSRPFQVLLYIAVSELVFMVYTSYTDVDAIFTLYEILYILATTFLLYRMGNAIAVVKMEEISLNKHVRNEVVNLSLKMFNVVLSFIALIFVLKVLGVSITALLSGLGIGGVAVAFAAKDTIANFFGSISILMSDLFEQGDWIAVDNMEGTVVEIGLRATTIRTFDNALIAIPNFKLADNGIKNWSRRKMGRRIKMHVGVTYESDMDDIRNALDELRVMLHEHPLLMGEKTQFMSNERQLKLVSREDLKGIKRQIMVYLDNYGASSIDILIYCFSRSVIWNEWLEAKEDVMFKIAEILKNNNLEFAYPTMMIHQAKTSEEEVIKEDEDL